MARARLGWLLAIVLAVAAAGGCAAIDTSVAGNPREPDVSASPGEEPSVRPADLQAP